MTNPTPLSENFTPVRSSFLPFALPDIGEDEINEVTEALRSGWVTTGPKTKQFEADFAVAVGAKHAVAVNSCTAALHLALEAVGVQRGDEVVTTPYTFAATAEVIRYFDAHPVLVDVDSRTLNLDPKLLERAITAKTKAVIPVHIAGFPADLDAIHEIAGRYGLPVIEDAAHAFPCETKGRKIGALSDVTCFSFYATKTMTTGEGGMICTDNQEIADRCRIMALHGISRDAWKRYQADGNWFYEVLLPGYKYNLTDIASGMGLAQLRKSESMWRRRKQIAEIFNDAFGEAPELQIPADSSEIKHAWHLYMLRLNLDRLSIDRAEFISRLRRHNIGASVHFIPLHLHPYYRQNYGYVPESFPVATHEYNREISLPIYSRMTDPDVRDVIAAVQSIVAETRL